MTLLEAARNLPLEYNENRVNELTLVHGSTVVPPSTTTDQDIVTSEL